MYGNRPDRATPSGVPVMMTSPGSRTMYWLRGWTIVAGSKIMSEGFESWRGSPVARVICGGRFSLGPFSGGSRDLVVALGEVVGHCVAGDAYFSLVHGGKVGRFLADH